MERNWNMKVNRHAKIVELINKYQIETQEELAERLNQVGFHVTQATVSRDIRDLKLTKVPAENGKQKYAVLESGNTAMGEKYIRILREFLRYRYKLVSMKSSEKNRFQNAFTVCNVALDSVVSDMFGKSATAITDYLTSDESFDPEHCISLLQRSLKKKAEQVLESIEGFSIADEQKARIKIVREHY